MVARRLPGMKIKETDSERVARLNKGLGPMGAGNTLKNPAWGKGSTGLPTPAAKSKPAADRFATPGPVAPWTKELTRRVAGKGINTGPTVIKPTNKPKPALGKFATPGPVSPWTKDLTKKVNGMNYNAVLRRMKRNR